MEWLVKTFEELNTHELYEMLKLRQEVFVLEQNCAYLDTDGIDADAIHLLAFDEKTLAAYCRIVFPGIKYKEPSIGRVVVNMPFRSTGLGYQLIERAVIISEKLFPAEFNRISAQAHLQQFYENCGFERVSEIYLEDNIPHIEMLLKNTVK